MHTNDNITRGTYMATGGSRKGERMQENTFYDIHMHAFNLSHPYLSPFIWRLIREIRAKLIKSRWLLLLSIVFILHPVLFPLCLILPAFRRYILTLIKRCMNQIKSMFNLLSVLENDIGSLFLLMENCLRERENPLLRKDGLHIGGETYTRIVLTPLMMDFGYKGKTPPKEGGKARRFHYDIPAGKPIVEQVTDVFNAIKKYRSTDSSEELSKKYPALGPGIKRVIEIYPFLGLNTKNYKLPEIERLLEKYFRDYTGSRKDFFNNLGQFDGNIENLGSNFFAGIKVYPPLGFDPWPEGQDNTEELEKVKHLYRICSEKGIPVATHGGRGGFVTVGSRELSAYTAVEKWKKILEHYPVLKLNLAHFPVNFRERKRREDTLRLVLDHENVYVNVSCRAINNRYYKQLRKLIDQLSSEERLKLRSRILFGTDFAVNLMWIESYNKYTDIFAKTDALTPKEKVTFCSANPERFLFSQAGSTL